MAEDAGRMRTWLLVQEAPGSTQPFQVSSLGCPQADFTKAEAASSIRVSQVGVRDPGHGPSPAAPRVHTSRKLELKCCRLSNTDTGACVLLPERGPHTCPKPRTSVALLEPS